MSFYITRQDEYEEIFNLKKIVSKRAKRIMWGGGFETNAESESTQERLLEIWNANSLLDMMNTVEENLSESEKGNQQIAIVPTTYKGKPMIRLDFIDMQNGNLSQYMQNGELIFARTTENRVQYGDMNFIITKIWTMNKMITKVNMLNSVYGAGNEIGVGDYNSRVPEFLREPAEWDYSELGRIPIITFTNTPSLSGTDENDMNPVDKLQSLVNAATYATFKELRNNSTRVIGTGINNRRNRNESGQVNWDALNSDLFMNIGKTKNIDPTASKSLIEVLQGDPKLNTFEEFLSFCINSALTYAGYSGEGDADANRTAAGTLFTKTGDVETTSIKRKQREKSLRELIELVISIDSRWNFINYESEEASITINENKVYDDQFKLDKLELADKLGVATIEDKIAVIHDTDDEKFIQQKKDELEQQQVERAPESVATNEVNNGEGQSSEGEEEND